MSHATEPTSETGSSASESDDASTERRPSRDGFRASWYALALGLLFLVALGTRAIGLGGAVTEDEDQWIARSGAFAHGLATHDWRRTYATGHPGVTVMWLTTLTLGIERTRPFERTTVGGPDVTTVPDFLVALDRARVPFAVLQAGLVVVAAALAGRLVGPATGLISGLLLAAEPFWAGVGPVVGMDGLLTGFLAVSLLAWLLAAGLGIESQPYTRDRLQIRGPLGLAALSGATFGLAFLSKTTVLLAGPAFAAVWLLAGWSWERGHPGRPGNVTSKRPGSGRPRSQGWVVLLASGAIWAVAAVLVVWLVWPAAWVSPAATVLRAIDFSVNLGGVPHAPGNFLLGQPIADPGPLFYLVALPLRLGPGTTIGLMLLFLFGAPRPVRRVAWTVFGFAVLFLVLLMLAPKKVDRYVLPVLPALGILAAIGWYEAGRRLREWRKAPSPQPPPPCEGEGAVGAINCAPTRPGSVRAQFIAPTGAVAPAGAMGGSLPSTLLMAILALSLQLWPLVQMGRYPLAAYNPLVGGVRAAEMSIPVGWGDGLDVAGDDIRRLAGGRTVVTSIWSPLRVSFGAHAPGPVVSDRQIAEADFFVDYVHARQRRLTPRQLVGRKPDAVVSIGGVDYARIYRLK